MKRNTQSRARRGTRGTETTRWGLRLQSVGVALLIHALLAWGLLRGVQSMVNGWPANTTLIQSPDRSPER